MNRWLRLQQHLIRFLARPLLGEAALVLQAQAQARLVHLPPAVPAAASLASLVFEAQLARHFLLAKARQGLVPVH